MRSKRVGVTLLTTLFGVSTVVVSTLIYAYEEGFMSYVTPERVGLFSLTAETYLLVLSISVVIVFYGLRHSVADRMGVVKGQGYAPLSPVWLVPYLLSVKKYRRYFVVSAVLYGLFYAIITSMVVYQPTVDFVQAYGARFPSAIIVPCCGAPLFAPIVTVYVVNHLGLLLVPLTVLLLLGISTLVGLNFMLAAFAFDSRVRGLGKGWLGGLGAVVGLFTGCPTCAGLFFANVLGGSGAVSFAALLAYYQPVFILLSLPVLVGTLYLVARTLTRVYREGCVYVRQGA